MDSDSESVQPWNVAVVHNEKLLSACLTHILKLSVGQSRSCIEGSTCVGLDVMIIVPMIFPGPTLLLTSDIIKQRLGAAALDRHVVLQECCMFALPPPFCFNKTIPDYVIMLREAPLFPTVSCHLSLMD